MIDKRVGPSTCISAQMWFVVPLLIALLTLITGCFPWLNGEYEFQLGNTIKVVNTGTVGLRVRSTPAGIITAVVPENWVFQISNIPPKSATLNGVSYLWWYVTDAEYESSPTSGWVAERYLTKVAPNNLSPSTVPAYFTASTGQIDSVVAQAHHEVDAGSEWYDYGTGNYLCLFFVRDVYSGQAMGWPSAHAAMVALQSQGAFHYATDSWNPPKGALVFFTSTSEYDHVGISIGSRQVAHVEGDRKAHVRDLGYIVELPYIETFTGWAYPPEEWCEGAPSSSLSYRVYDDPSENWPSANVTTPAGIEGGNIIDIFKNGQLIAKLDAEMQTIRPYYNSDPATYAFLAAEYREMYNGDWHFPVQFQPTIALVNGNCVLSVESKTANNAIQSSYSITIHQDGSIYLDKTATVPTALATDEYSIEDGNIGVLFGGRPMAGGAHVEVYDEGTLYSWDPASQSGWGDIDTSHTLENGDWVSFKEANSSVTLKFLAEDTAGFDNNGNPSPLAAVIQYGPEGRVLVVVGRKGVAMWNPTNLPAGQYVVRGWISAN